MRTLCGLDNPSAPVLLPISIAVTSTSMQAQVAAGALNAPLPWGDIPGGRYFNEGSQRRYPELEQAFARFRIEATGGESPALRKLRGEM
ncbi:hypothetical protein [Janthinobacterium sp. HLS12-2]|uniref:hypothetical protein n=1 Tax=Janthinobacterium sp. HLS12-2 TaxID=1259324 RepID=UPI003F20FA02